MPKLEQKLIELGYTKKFDYYYQRYDKLKYGFFIKIEIITIEGKKTLNPYISNCYIGKQQDIDNLQQAFNEMQKDLEILKGCEE